MQVPLNEHDFYDHLFNQQKDQKLDFFKILEVHEILKEKPSSIMGSKILGRKFSIMGKVNEHESHATNHNHF